MRATKILPAAATMLMLLTAGCGVAGTAQWISTPGGLQATTVSDAAEGDAVMIDRTPPTNPGAPDTLSHSKVPSPSSAGDKDGDKDAASAPTPKPAESSALPPELVEAIEAATNYLSFMPFSEKGLIEQLSSDAGDGFPHDVAAAAVSSLDIDWNEQAVKAATNYLSLMSFSKQGLIEQLESDSGDGYTHAQAVYGADHAYGTAAENGAASPNGGGSAEISNAIEAAENYLSMMPFSEKGLVEQLSTSAGDGYSLDAATAAVASLDVDWNEQAAKSAANYLELMSFSRQELVDQLISGDGYTRAQAEYGVGKSYQ
jgi:predicted 3-demethylubiquinone-9 3-methyltransferase (glyoxalase superfamily)